MSDDPYKAPAVEVEAPRWSGPRPRPVTRVTVAMWLLIGGSGAYMLWLIMSSHLSGVGSHPMERFIAVWFVLFSVAGLKGRWGPVIPCTIFGAVLCVMMTSGILPNTPYIIIWQAIGALIGAVVGAFAAWMIDARRSSPSPNGSDEHTE